MYSGIQKFKEKVDWRCIYQNELDEASIILKK